MKARCLFRWMGKGYEASQFLGWRRECQGFQLFLGKYWALVALWLPLVARSWRQAHLASRPAFYLAHSGTGMGVSQMKTGESLLIKCWGKLLVLGSGEKNRPRMR